VNDRFVPLDLGALRERLRLPRSALSRFLGVSEASLGRWEKKGARGPRGLTLLVLDQMSRASRHVGVGEVRRIVLDRDIPLGLALLRLFDAAAD
jgi:hypothetical protein